MPPLSSKLSLIDDGAVVWHSSLLGEITGSELKNILLSFDTAPFRGKRVALGKMPAVELLAALVVLDWTADTILLLPTEEPPEARAKRLAEMHVDILLEGSGVGLVSSLNQYRASGRSTACARPDDSSCPVAGETTWLLPTSGTTGSSKLIPHTSGTLTRGMDGRRSCSGFVWGSLYSFSRFAGLQVFLQSWISCTPLVVCEEDEDLGMRLVRLASSGCSALSATPSMWRKLAMHPASSGLRLRQVTLGGEIADQPVLDLLHQQYPAARVTHVYASTEAGVGFSVRDGKAGFPVGYLQEPPGDVRIKVDERGHLLLNRGAAATEASVDEGAWMDSGDVVKIAGDRVLFVGRANGSINVGGNKVMPEEVESVIRELSEIVFVQVRGRRSSILGSIVEASVRLVGGTSLTAEHRKRIQSHCRARLDGYKVPSVITALDDIHLTASGKLSRQN